MKILKINYFAGILVTAIVILSGCVDLYKLETLEKAPDVHIIESLKNSGKVFIIHSKDTAFQLTNYSIKEDKIEGILSPVSQMQVKYLHPKSRVKNVYDKEDENEVLNEAHIYVPTANSLDTTAYFSIPVSNILRIDINEKNVQATRRSHVAGNIILVGTLIGGVILLIGLAASSISFTNGLWGGG